MAAMEAEIAELKEEEVPADDADWEAPAAGKAPEPKCPPPAKRRRTTRALPSSASGSQTPGDAAEQGTGVVASLDQAFARQTRSAMAFTKAMPHTKKKSKTQRKAHDATSKIQHATKKHKPEQQTHLRRLHTGNG
jgi:hypothetical protein